jgi:Ca2+-transporting ATPase
VIAERPIDKVHARPTAWHATSIDRVATLLDTGRGGLSAKVAAARLVVDGPNALAPSPVPSVLLRFLRQFNSP